MTDIVERLRFNANRKSNLDADKASLSEAAEEIERLRAALESLTKDPPATLDEPDTDAEVITKMRAIARAALEPKP